MRTIVILLTLLLAGSLQAEEKKSRKRMFWVSVAALGISAALDVHSSWGKAELNPLARSSTGRLGMKGAGIKLGTTGGLLGLEYLLLRKNEDFSRAATVVNFGLSGAWTGAAVRNYGIERPPRSWRPDTPPRPMGVPAVPR
jgi:hypothetical protein